MRTITIIAPRGLQNILLEILNPIKFNKSDVADMNWQKFEFIGTVACPHAKLKNYKKGVYQSVKLVSTEMGGVEVVY